jgi:hypothetical protein
MSTQSDFVDSRLHSLGRCFFCQTEFDTVAALGALEPTCADAVLDVGIVILL